MLYIVTVCNIFSFIADNAHEIYFVGCEVFTAVIMKTKSYKTINFSYIVRHFIGMNFRSLICSILSCIRALIIRDRHCMSAC